jgi:DNA modification methylase
MTIHAIGNATVYVGDCLESLRTMPEKSVHCCVTSPPYWGLRDYGVSGQLGLEKTPEEYVSKMVEVFREVRRVLRDDGTLWLNLGDSYAATTKQTGRNDRDRPHNGEPRGTYDVGTAGDKTEIRTALNGLKPKDLVGIPWRVAFALQADGWYLRQDIIWAKPNPMPESVTDRCTKSHEYVFLLSKSAKYFYDADAVKEPVVRAWNSSNGGNLSPTGIHKANGAMRERGGSYPVCDGTRNRRSVWQISTRPYKGAHFATFPPALIEPCVKAGCPAGGVVLDPFGGSGTTGRVASDLGRSSILCELNTDYVELIRQRLTEPAKPVKKKRAKAAC